MSSYPKAKYHPSHGQRDVMDAEAEKNLGEGWYDRWDQALAAKEAPDEQFEEQPKRRGRPPKVTE